MGPLHRIVLYGRFIFGVLEVADRMATIQDMHSRESGCGNGGENRFSSKVTRQGELTSLSFVLICRILNKISALFKLNK